MAAHNYAPQMRAMYDALSAGNYQVAAKLQRWLTPRMAALFMFPSPSPVKAVLAAQGWPPTTAACRFATRPEKKRSNWQPPWGYLATPWRVNYQPT